MNLPVGILTIAHVAVIITAWVFRMLSLPLPRVRVTGSWRPVVATTVFLLMSSTIALYAGGAIYVAWMSGEAQRAYVGEHITNLISSNAIYYENK